MCDSFVQKELSKGGLGGEVNTWTRKHNVRRRHHLQEKQKTVSMRDEVNNFWIIVNI